MLAVVFQFVPNVFMYQREEMWSEPWRLFTSHFVHVGWIHCLLNMSAFTFLPLIFPKTNWKLLISGMLILPLMISLGIYLLCENIYAYAGFSGVLHGLYILVALQHLTDPKEKRFAWVILLGIIIKLLWELKVNENSITADLIGSPILIEAHQLGAIGALVLFVGVRTFNTGMK